MYSPRIATRVDEKDRIQTQNDRLAHYIDRARNLEEENNALVAQSATLSQSKMRETSSMRSMYDAELAEARKLLDEITTEKAKLQLDNNKSRDEMKDLKASFAALTKARDDAEAKYKRVSVELEEVRSRYQISNREKTDLADGKKALAAELLLLKGQLAHAKKECEEELLRRVDAENRLLSLKEEREFGLQIHRKELEEMQSSVSIATVVEETDGHSDDYDRILCEKLHELRCEFTEEALALKQQMEEAYQAKVDDAKEEALNERQHSNTLSNRLAEMRLKLDEMKNEHGPCSVRIESLEKSLVDVRHEISLERDEHKVNVARLEAILAERDEALDDWETEFQKLLHAKVSLDMEIQAYQKMLDGEDERVSNTPKLKVRTASTTSQSRKRCHHERDGGEVTTSVSRSRSVSNTATGALQIDKIDTDNNFVRVYNSSPAELKLGGFAISHQVDNAPPVEYKFTPKFVVKGNEYVTVWGAGSGQKHKPSEGELLMKFGDWADGDKFASSILGSDGVVFAKWVEEEPLVTSTESMQTTSSSGGASGSTARSTKRIRRTGGSTTSTSDNCVIS